MLIYTTKTSLGRSIGKTDDTVRRMIRDNEVQDVFSIDKNDKKTKVGYILSKYCNQ